MRKKLVAGNWKMNQNSAEISLFASDILSRLQDSTPNADILICPPFVYIEQLKSLFAHSNIQLGAQNVNNNKNGAFTGEISAAMLSDIEIKWCIVGHSERRKYNHESNTELTQKIEQLFSMQINPVFCCGEMLPERNAGNHFEVVKKQIEGVLWDLPEDVINTITIAYEPVWAIGTGVTASNNQAQEMHAFIRMLVSGKFGDTLAQNIRILYGGSVTADNASELFLMPDIDGGLVGGASLKAESFFQIINSCK